MSKDDFVWTDAMIEEYIRHRINMARYGHHPNHMSIEQFKQSKMPKKDKYYEVTEIINKHGGKTTKAIDSISWEDYCGLKSFDGFKINAVKDLRSGEVFTVGEECSFPYAVARIKQFNVSGNTLDVLGNSDDGVEHGERGINAFPRIKKLSPQKEQSKSEQPKKDRIEVKDVSIKEILIRFEGPTLPQRKIDELKATIEKIINNEEWITASQNISEALREAEEKAFNAAREALVPTAMGDQLKKYPYFENYLNSKSKQ